ncbi:hypothetical protein HY643_05270, partial [Candidatus Woesearchaeota archaeon]|nr:hypothetical protein [Candidatus Woesearchaeota archaeon]
IDLDGVTGKLIGATARADIFARTSEFSSEKISGVDAALFAKVYAHEISHLDGVINEGRANYRADKVLEDMTLIFPDDGYDLQLEKDKLISVGHAYTLSTINETMAKLKKVVPLELMVQHLNDLGLHLENVSEEATKGKKNQLNKNYCPLTSIINWTYNVKGITRALLKVQSVVGGSNPNSGYTIDNYKLMKRDNTI